MFVSLRKKIGAFGIKSLAKTFIKIIIASAIMGINAKFTYNYLITNISQNLSLIIAVGIGLLIYIIIISFVKIREVDTVIQAVKRKLKRAQK